MLDLTEILNFHAKAGSSSLLGDGPFKSPGQLLAPGKILSPRFPEVWTDHSED